MSSITDMNMERLWNVAGRTRRANRCRTEAPKSSLIGLLAGMLASGYEISRVIRKRIEEHFGWGKTIGAIRQTMYRGIRKVDQQFKLTMTASNLVRMAPVLYGSPKGAAV